MAKLTAKIKYERSLSDKHAKAFLFPDGKLYTLGQLLRKKEQNYQIEFRQNYFNVYYKGGNILRVTNGFKFHFDIRYCDNKPASKYKELIQTILKKQNLTEAINNLDKFAFEMDSWWAANPKPERIQQHEICLQNREDESGVYVADIEYAATDYGRADILAVKYNAVKGLFKIYIIEYKHKHNAISSGIKIEHGIVTPSSTKKHQFKAGLYKHYLDAVNLVSAPQIKRALELTVRNSLYARKQLELASFTQIERLEDIRFDPEIEMRFVLSGCKQNHTAIHRELDAIRIAGKNLKWDIIYIPENNFKLAI